eukprot:CAMPEP_0172518568 /NCGR_PEP_ID=MMETSP1066-20121228/290899_1 /TAXON_ID=671091 /ORGANISM="Coscinodiscus wailesii, Strain CCMP2513" /LENGTH=597 /DNA_ID=CAMNT_0013300987 /DNA_START=171 /DNA_END=1964 /DNA_ORIENTATION=-
MHLPILRILSSLAVLCAAIAFYSLIDPRSQTTNLLRTSHNRNLWITLNPFNDPKDIESKLGRYQPDYQVASYESYGFFDDVALPDWQRMRSITRNRQYKESKAKVFYHENWETEFSCPRERRVGNIGDGGKWVCDPHRVQKLSSSRKTDDGKDSPCLVYSVGSEGNHFFEHGIMDTMGEDVCEIHTFEIRGPEQMIMRDSTDEDRRKTKKINMHYHWGLRGSSEPAGEGLYTLSETIKKLGHEGRVIDIFKIDCEGCEWRTYPDWLNAPAMLQQILVEVHRVTDEHSNFFESMRNAGYVTFHKEPNIMTRGKCVEYAFLKLRPDAIKEDYALAKKESYGFFYDVDREDWEMAKTIIQHRQADNHAKLSSHYNQRNYPLYYQDNWEPDFSCFFEERFGDNQDDVQFWVCDPHRIPLLSKVRKTSQGKPDPCLIYSIVTVGNHGFERSLDFLNEFGGNCQIHVFDGRSQDQIHLDDHAELSHINFHYDWTIRGSHEESSKGSRTLDEIVKNLGHQGRTIDILAVNCDGCEWRVFKDWFSIPAHPHQILVEVKGQPDNADEFFQSIQDNGYVTFHKDMDYARTGNVFDYSFLKLNLNYAL